MNFALKMYIFIVLAVSLVATTIYMNMDIPHWVMMIVVILQGSALFALVNNIRGEE